MATVLVVDDRPADRQLLTALLGYAGHQALEAENGVEALEIVRHARPDLVIADVLMPAIDGYEFVRQLRSDPLIARTAVIFYTATYYEQEARALARACGVHQFLVKPVEPEVMLRTVNAVLASAATSLPALPPEEFAREHLRLLSDKLVHNVHALETANARLAVLIDLGLYLATESDQQRLLDRCCETARQLLGAEYAAIGILDDSRTKLRSQATSGSDGLIQGDAELRQADLGVFARLLAEGSPVRLYGEEASVAALELPPAHPPVRSFLGVRLASPTSVYGWLYVAVGAGGGPFSDADAECATMLGGQVAVAYENAWRHEVIQRYARELEQRVEEARAAVRARDEFLSTAAHELKTPLTSLHGFTQLLLRRASRGELTDPDSLYMYTGLQTVEEQSGKLARLISQLLDVSRLAAGRLVLERAPADLSKLAHAVVAAAQITTSRHHLRLETPLSLSVFLDPLRIEQVLTNLVDNAIKYSPEGGEVALQITLADTAPGQPSVVRVTVRDHGLGIPLEHREHIFDRFYQAHANMYRSGMGLGLHISHQIVQLHGGTIEVEYPADGGTRFVVTLPTGVAETQERVSRQMPPLGNGRRRGQRPGQNR